MSKNLIESLPVLKVGLDKWLKRSLHQAIAAGINPCATYVALRREHQWGQIGKCVVVPHHGDMFTYYVLVYDCKVVDMANLTGTTSYFSYRNLEIIPDDELPLGTSEKDVNWMRGKIPLEPPQYGGTYELRRVPTKAGPTPPVVPITPDPYEQLELPSVEERWEKN